MATNSSISNSFIDTILPYYGQERQASPIWDESRQMFIVDQYTSQAGHTYYLGVRFSERIVTVIHIGLFHNWTYFNGLDMYTFNGTKRELIGQVKSDNYYHEEEVRALSVKMLKDYMVSQLKMSHKHYDEDQVDSQARQIISNSCYSLLSDNESLKLFDEMKPLLLEIRSEFKQLN